MKRRHLLLGAAATGASAAALSAGWRIFGPRTGGSDSAGDPIRLASVGVLNHDDAPHEVTVEISRDGETVVERTLRADAERVSTMTDGLPADVGRYRVRATLGGETIATSPGDDRDGDCLALVVTIERDGSLGSTLVGPDQSGCEPTTN